MVFNSEVANSFSVTFSNDHIICFEGLGTGLYIHKVDSVTPYSFLNTDNENKSFYTRREVLAAEQARIQQGQLGWPSDQEYYEIVRDAHLNNSKCSTDDIQRAKHIYSSMAMKLLKGKSTYKAVNSNAQIQRVPLSPIILQTHPNDNLDIDFLYV